MKIGVNARFLLIPYSGIGQYTRNLILALSKIDKKNQYYLVVPKKIPKKEKLIKRIKRGGFKVSETHFSGTGLRSDIPLGKLLRFVKQ